MRPSLWILKNFLILVISIAAQESAAVNRMSLETHDLMISKLERVLETYRGQLDQKWTVEARLADLYSDRSRLRFMKEQGQNCDNCLQSRKDRKSALKIYERVYRQADLKSKEKMILQMAHLYQADGKVNRAIQLFQSITRRPRNYQPLLVGQAYSGLGEIEFQRARYQKSLNYFRKALKIPETPDQHYVSYRMAWCLLNLGRDNTATAKLIQLLQQRDAQVSASFYQDVAKDLTTFLARGTLDKHDIQTLMTFTAPEERGSSLLALAEEADRLGHKQPAMMAYRTYANEFSENDAEKLSIQIRLARLALDQGNKVEATNAFHGSVETAKKSVCRNTSKPDCREIEKQLIQFLTNWQKLSKSRPDKNLLKAYLHFSALFTENFEIHYRGAELAFLLKKYKSATQSYLSASRAAQQNEVPAKKKRAKKVFETSLVKAIEASESTKDRNLQLKALKNYLALNPKGKFSEKVKYQISFIKYQNKDYKTAAVEFYGLTKSLKSNTFKTLSADLALDSLAKLKKSELLRTRSIELSKIVPKRAKEFQRIGAEALIDQSQKTLKQGKASSSDLKLILVIKSYPQRKLKKDQKIRLAKNRLLLAERIKNLDEVRFAAKALLAQKGLKEADRQSAHASLGWAAEMGLDFATAYRNYLQVNPSTTRRQVEHQLKLATLLELQGKNPSRHYKKSLQIVRSKKQIAQIHYRLTLNSKNPWSYIRKYRRQIEAAPTLYVQLLLEVQASRPNTKELTAALKRARAKRSPLYSAAQRALWLKTWKNQFKNLTSHRIARRPDRKTQKDIKRRVRLLSQLEKKTQASLSQPDLTAQVFHLDLYAKENLRFYSELMGLPKPKGLNRSERAQYRKLLKNSSQIYVQNNRTAVNQLESLWQSGKVIPQLKSNSSAERSFLRPHVAQEIRELRRLAPRKYRPQLDQAVRKLRSQPSQKELVQAMRNVRENPFSESRLGRLRELNARSGRLVSSAYFDARIQALKKGKN